MIKSTLNIRQLIHSTHNHLKFVVAQTSNYDVIGVVDHSYDVFGLGNFWPKFGPMVGSTLKSWSKIGSI
jgi:hypothetical protein